MPTDRNKNDGTSANRLPDPTPDEQARSASLSEIIRKEVGDNSLSFTRFMELALYAPGLGYYSAGATKFGPSGDFVTAPELGDVFARCLAQQCAQVLSVLEGGDILEVGGGSGVFAADLLTELAHLDQLPDHYYLLEVSASLREHQKQQIREKIPELIQRIHWIDTFPKSLRGLVLANEVIDAMPVTLFTNHGGSIRERCVAVDGENFVWIDGPASNELTERINKLDLPSDYVSEVNFFGEAWIRSISEFLSQGVVLIVDYGFPEHEYYHPQRSMGTLMCHYRHRAHSNPLILAGLQDITAHVDFTAMATAADETGMDVLGYTAQAPFLMSNGLEDVLLKSQATDVSRHLELTNQVKKLTLPSEMGELFKVLALGKKFDSSLQGFGLQDRRGRL